MLDDSLHKALYGRGKALYQSTHHYKDFGLLELTVSKPVSSLALTKNEHYWIAIIGRDILNSCELTINWQEETISIERLPTTVEATASPC